MVDQWEPQVRYDAGSIVEFEGVQYKIIQPHQSQSDWSPPVTPALWSRLPRDYDCSNQQPHPQVPVDSYQPHPDQKVDIPHEEQKKNWWDLDDKRKKDLEVGGGLLAGAALLGGGYMAWKHHEKSQEDNKALIWALQNWLRDAQVRTEKYNTNGPDGPVTWILNRGTSLPNYAIQCGQDEHGVALYSCRVFQDGGIQLGKSGSPFQKGAVIGYKHQEIQVDTYEVLVGDNSAVTWVEASGTIDIDSLGIRPVEGGREQDGTPLYLVQAPHNGGVHPGKASPKLNGAYIAYQGKEVQVSQYQILVYA